MTDHEPPSLGTRIAGYAGGVVNIGHLTSFPRYFTRETSASSSSCSGYFILLLPHHQAMAESPGTAEDDWGELDGDEEPLFADDIDYEDDLPPLPPPMPSQLSQVANNHTAGALRVNANSEENFGGVYVEGMFSNLTHPLLIG